MEDLSSLIGRIYDAALDPALWTEVLREIGRFCAAARTALVTENAEDPSLTVLYTSFDDPEWIGRYLQSYLLINPMRLATVASATAGDVILS